MRLILSNLMSFSLLAQGAITFAYPEAEPRAGLCTTPAKRLSWHDMCDDDKVAYLKATQCIFSSPAKTKLPGVKTRWDDLASLHQIFSLQIHTTATFLPFHRFFLHLHGILLQECGYTGPLAYWDETRDAGNFLGSSVLDPTFGFGGTGQGSNNCIPDGPFKDAIVNIGPLFTLSPRCVNRNITDDLSGLTSQIYVDEALNHTTYWDAQHGIYMGPHYYGHLALAFMDAEPITSAGDPLFMLHHGFVDKMWADWQAQDPSRVYEINGPNAQDPEVGFFELPGGMLEEEAIVGKPTPEMLAATPDPQAGDGGPETTLDHLMYSAGILPNATLRDIMDTKGDYLCYEYV